MGAQLRNGYRRKDRDDGDDDHELDEGEPLVFLADQNMGKNFLCPPCRVATYSKGACAAPSLTIPSNLLRPTPNLLKNISNQVEIVNLPFP